MAGTITPPAAAVMGTIAVETFRRLPATNSCLSSKPTMKKKIARIPSDAHSPTVM